MQQILTYIFLIIYSVTILGIILVVITDNRNPLKTLPWIIVLVLAPVVGLIFYFFFGLSGNLCHISRLYWNQHGIRSNQRIDCH